MSCGEKTGECGLEQGLDRRGEDGAPQEKAWCVEGQGGGRERGELRGHGDPSGAGCRLTGEAFHAVSRLFWAHRHGSFLTWGRRCPLLDHPENVLCRRFPTWTYSGLACLHNQELSLFFCLTTEVCGIYGVNKGCSFYTY